ncbi:MAG: outer membrane beta-barrel domain-containing protein [Persicimonas sp.]
MFSFVFKKLQELRRKQENAVTFHIQPAKLFGLLVCATALVVASPALAQESAEDVDEEASDEASEETEEDSELEDLDPDDPEYWAKARDVYTVQKRPFLKEGRFAATIYGGIIPNNIFEQYFPAGLRLNYYVLENIGVELASSYALKSETGLNDTISDERGIGSDDVLIGDTQLSHTSFGLVWSPFYGKTSYYDSALKYFDLHLFAGLGAVVTETQESRNQPPAIEVKPEGALGAGLSAYLSDNLTLRVDFRQFVFEKVNPPGGVSKATEGSVGVGWFF